MTRIQRSFYPPAKDGGMYPGKGTTSEGFVTDAVRRTYSRNINPQAYLCTSCIVLKSDMLTTAGNGHRSHLGLLFLALSSPKKPLTPGQEVGGRSRFEETCLAHINHFTPSPKTIMADLSSSSHSLFSAAPSLSLPPDYGGTSATRNPFRSMMRP